MLYCADEGRLENKTQANVLERADERLEEDPDEPAA